MGRQCHRQQRKFISHKALYFSVSQILYGFSSPYSTGGGLCGKVRTRQRDTEGSKPSGFAQRIAHGTLILSVGAGQRDQFGRLLLRLRLGTVHSAGVYPRHD